MVINEQRIRAMVVMKIIENCTIELDNTGQERYSLDENQFGKLIDALVKDIKAIQCCESDNEPSCLGAVSNSVCDCCIPSPEDPFEYENPICSKCGGAIKQNDL